VSDLAARYVEDKALRDAALQLFKSDLALIREELGARGLGTRVKDRVSDAALDMLDEAIDYSEANKGWVAAGTAALVLWFARKPLLAWLGELLGDEEPEGDGGRSGDD
jgi:hypothetical protein